MGHTERLYEHQVNQDLNVLDCVDQITEARLKQKIDNDRESSSSDH